VTTALITGATSGIRRAAAKKLAQLGIRMRAGVGIGSKWAAGRRGTIGAPPAVMNAVLDALAPGITNLDMPATPERVFRAIDQHRQN
jgi:NAD(P)-dependent dehydrogenase (short-subunit alcohol dehydrogenase family)